MFKDLRTHKTDYSVLAAIVGAFIIVFVSNLDSVTTLMFATILFSLSYILWGAWHHHNTKSLNGHIMLEYFLVATLAVVIVGTLLI